jgi:opacity protein-like surface antigen
LGKSLLIFVLSTFTLNSSLALAATQDKLDISLKQWDIEGSFDYYLHYQDSLQLLSQVSMPQKQNMNILNIKYLTDNRNYIKVQYGSTSSGSKGIGSDSDWTTTGSNTKTDYGTMNFNGDQKMVAIDVGTIVSKSDKNKTSVFVGWGKRDTNNELTNVIYHLESSVDVGNVSQADNGSYLNGTFSGLHIGVENEYKLNKKISLSSGLSTSYLDAKAYGYWANHSPAWNWTDSGHTWGYDMNLGLKYAINQNIKAELGYYYSYAKMTDGNEVLNENNGTIDNLSGIDLGYKQKGYYLGLNSKF